jgi:hypothetical protein
MSKSEFIFHTLLGGVSLLTSICLYALAADSICSGTGTGQNEVLLLCQNYALIFPIALNLLLFGGLPSLLRNMGIRAIYRIIVSISAAVLMFVLSPVIWKGTLFLIRVR